MMFDTGICDIFITETSIEDLKRDIPESIITEKDDIVYIIDEIERSMHSKLIIKFIEIFEEMHKDRKIQLIFTTHETSLLNENIFRQDEIWFVERDIDSKSKIYSLNKFN